MNVLKEESPFGAFLLYAFYQTIGTMKRKQFLSTIALGTTALSFAPVSCKRDISGTEQEDQKVGINTNYRDRDWADLFLPISTDIDVNTLNILDAERAEVNGDPLEPWGFRYFRDADWIDGWTTSDGLSLSWIIDSPVAFSCSVALVYACASGSEGSVIEVVSETAGYVGYGYNGRKPRNKISGVTEVTSSWLSDWRNFERKEIPGTLQIPQGKSVITLRAVTKAKSATAVMSFHSLEIIPETAREAIAKEKQRAKKLKSSTDWFVDAKYGVMFHYSPTVYPRHGARKSFDQAVRDFDVNQFVEMVLETGAGYVFFFISHALFWFPAPLKTVEEILPGRTCNRDLIADIAKALEPHGIRLMLYYNPAYIDDLDWRIAAGWGKRLHIQTEKECGDSDKWDTNPFYGNQIKILEEIGNRYGRLVWGYWFDNSYPHQLFERQMQACKVGNKDRIIGYNSGIYPRITDFQDFFAAEFGCSPILPPKGYFDKGGPQEGLQPHGTIFIDGAWHHFLPETEIGPQRFTTESLIAYTRECIARKMVLTINMCMYQDGTISGQSLEQMKSLRKAIRS